MLDVLDPLEDDPPDDPLELDELLADELLDDESEDEVLLFAAPASDDPLDPLDLVDDSLEPLCPFEARLSL